MSTSNPTAGFHFTDQDIYAQQLSVDEVALGHKIAPTSPEAA